MTRFLVFLDRGTRPERNAITQYLKGQAGWAWAHHTDDLWFVVAHDGVTSIQLRDALVATVPGRVVVVVQTDGKALVAGRASPKLWDWLKRSWLKYDQA